MGINSLIIRRAAAFALLAALVVGFSWSANSAGGATRTIELTAGAAGTVDLPGEVADVLVANPAVADVGTLRSNRLYVVGKTVGDTNVLAFDAQGNQLANVAVRISVDEGTIRSALQKFFPSEKVDARAVKNDLVLTGLVSTPAVANQVRDLAGRFVAGPGQTIVDLMKVQGEQQVMLKVKVIEAKRAALREYGFETDFKPGSSQSFNAVGGQSGLSALTPFGVGSLLVTKGSDFGPLKVSLAALEQDGLINTLAEPNLTAISGETAGFLAGGEFPVPTGRDSNGNVTIEFKQFGVALNFTPTVLSSDRISLQLSTEVSAKSPTDSVTLVNTQIPGLTTRRAETTVQMSSGGTIMIAGLLKSDDVHTLTGFPGLQNLPVLGELFKSKSFSRNESELVILVTPYLVEPYAEAQAERVAAASPVLPGGPAVAAAPAPAVPAPNALSAAPATTLTSADMAAPPGEKAAAAAEKAPLEKPRTAGASPLAHAFIDGLRRTYGSRAPAMEAKPAGYMVD